MKIGIITLPLHTNYGGILQAYALQTVLQRMGHDVQIIDRDSMKMRKLSLWKMPLAYSKRIVKNLIGRPTPIFLEQKLNLETPVIRQHTNKFIEKYIRRFIIEDFNQIKDAEFDAFVVGSDQVWRPRYFEPMFGADISDAYLGFAKGRDVIRLSYAASFGVDTWEYNSRQTENCKELLKLFKGVSVREDSAVELCRKYYGIDAVHVLDPTMLLSLEDYISLIDVARPSQSDGELLTYILDVTEEKSKFIKDVSAKTGYKPFSVIAQSTDFNTEVSMRIQPPLESWLKGFMDAKIVITDSFHACVFSILFRKPFLAIVNEGRGASRFRSLLGLFGLEDRIVDINKPISKEIIEIPVPVSVYKTLDALRDKSFDFLNKINNE